MSTFLSFKFSPAALQKIVALLLAYNMESFIWALYLEHIHVVLAKSHCTVTMLLHDFGPMVVVYCLFIFSTLLLFLKMETRFSQLYISLARSGHASSLD